MAYRTFRCLTTAANPQGAGVALDLDPNTAQRTPGIYQVALSGSTAARPLASDADFAGRGLQAGIHYFDITLGKIVISDGAGNWRDPASGSIV